MALLKGIYGQRKAQLQIAFDISRQQFLSLLVCMQAREDNSLCGPSSLACLPVCECVLARGVDGKVLDFGAVPMLLADVVPKSLQESLGGILGGGLAWKHRLRDAVCKGDVFHSQNWTRLEYQREKNWQQNETLIFTTRGI